MELYNGKFLSRNYSGEYFLKVIGSRKMKLRRRGLFEENQDAQRNSV